MGRMVSFNVTSTAKGIQTQLQAKEHQYYLDEPSHVGGQNSGPTPLHALLGALAGCESITAFAAAKSMNLHVEEVSIHVIGELNPDGMKGNKEVKTYYEKVEIHVQLSSSESIEDIHALKHKVEERCPVYNLFKAAGVKMISKWELKGNTT
ncbi:OsmC family protein [Bacillus pinisoli]|uniref:OsmC family protein n=1 Tax=Bacillus pinisoli TaxID=2901866 RepID=UPI001FF4D4F8|nr:OsmC family protein [Bacillus pinisoli]